MDNRYKFRVWFNNKMIESESVCDKRDYHFVSFEHGYSVHPDLSEEGKIMQCVGLPDKNGKLTYEGDILHIKDKVELTATIFWDQNHCDYRLRSKDFIGVFNINIAKISEVIGNIYENEGLVE